MSLSLVPPICGIEVREKVQGNSKKPEPIFQVGWWENEINKKGKVTQDSGRWNKARDGRYSSLLFSSI